MNDNLKSVGVDVSAITKQIQSLGKNFAGLAKTDLPRVQLSKDIDYSFLSLNKEAKAAFEVINKEKREQTQREVENNESLKSLVDYNAEVVNYNKELVTLNRQILSKINNINESLSDTYDAINNNAEKSREYQIEHSLLMFKLIEILESKEDEKGTKLSEFLGGLSGNVAAGLMVEYLKMKLGLSN